MYTNHISDIWKGCTKFVLILGYMHTLYQCSMFSSLSKEVTRTTGCSTFLLFFPHVIIFNANVQLIHGSNRSMKRCRRSSQIIFQNAIAFSLHLKQILVLIVKCDLSGLAYPPYSTVAITQVSCTNFESHGTPVSSRIVCHGVLQMARPGAVMDMYIVNMFSNNIRALFSNQSSLAKHKFKDTIIRNMKRQQQNIKASQVPSGHGTLL